MANLETNLGDTPYVTKVAQTLVGMPFGTAGGATPPTTGQIWPRGGRGT